MGLSDWKKATSDIMGVGVWREWYGYQFFVWRYRKRVAPRKFVPYFIWQLKDPSGKLVKQGRSKTEDLANKRVFDAYADLCLDEGLELLIGDPRGW